MRHQWGPMQFPLLFVPLVYGISSTPDTCAQPQKSGGFTECGPPDDEGWISCCTYIPEEDDLSCEYCRELSPGNWECDTTLPDEAVVPTNLPTLEHVPTTPLFGQNIPQDLQTLTEAPTPLPTLPTGPLTTPEDDENGDEDGTPSPGVRPPLRENLPELKEVPDDKQPEQDEEPSDEGKEDSSEGAETAGPLT